MDITQLGVEEATARYLELCNFYAAEPARGKNSAPDCYGPHAQKLSRSYAVRYQSRGTTEYPLSLRELLEKLQAVADQYGNNDLVVTNIHSVNVTATSNGVRKVHLL